MSSALSVFVCTTPKECLALVVEQLGFFGRKQPLLVRAILKIRIERMIATVANDMNEAHVRKHFVKEREE